MILVENKNGKKKEQITFKNCGKELQAIKCIGTKAEISQFLEINYNSQKILPLKMEKFIGFDIKTLKNSKLCDSLEAIKKRNKGYAVREWDGIDISGSAKNMSFELVQTNSDQEAVCARVSLFYMKKGYITGQVRMLLNKEPEVMLTLTAIWTQLILDNSYEDEIYCGLLFADERTAIGVGKILGKNIDELLVLEAAAKEKLTLADDSEQLSDGEKLFLEEYKTRKTDALILNNIHIADRIVNAMDVSVEEASSVETFLEEINSQLIELELEALTFFVINKILDNVELVDSFDGIDVTAGYDIQLPNIDEATWNKFNYMFPAGSKFKDSDNLLFGAVDTDGNALGVMSVDFAPEVYTINWLFVLPEHRFKGVGTFLINEIIGYMELTDNIRELEVYYNSEENDVNAFLNATGRFDVASYAREYFINASDMTKSAIFKRLQNMPHRVESFASQTESTKRELFYRVKEEGYLTVTDQETFAANLVEDLCFCRRRGNRITGLVWFLGSPTKSKELTLELLYSEDVDTTTDLLAAVCKTVDKKFSDYVIRITPVNEKSLKLLEGFFGKLTGKIEKYTANWNYM